MRTVVYGVIVYSMIGFEWSGAKFFLYLLFMFATLLYYTFYGMMTVALTPNLSLATILAGSLFGIWNLFSGFVIPVTVSFSTLLQFKLTCEIHKQVAIIEFLINLFCLVSAEDASMVEMVLLGMPCSVEPVWNAGFAIW